MSEENFEKDVEEAMGCVSNALNELTGVKAYALTQDELQQLKAAQYALRYISREYDNSKSAEDAL